MLSSSKKSKLFISFINKQTKQNSFGLESGDSFIWLKYNNFTCRYDSFFLIYALQIKNILQTLNIKNEVIDLYNNILDIILNSNVENLREGI